MPRMKLSEQIRKIIEHAPVSRHRLCQLTGINTGNLTEFMAGNRGLSMESLDALANVLGLQVKVNKATASKLAADAPGPGRPAVKPSTQRTR